MRKLLATIWLAILNLLEAGAEADADFGPLKAAQRELGVKGK